MKSWGWSHHYRISALIRKDRRGFVPRKGQSTTWTGKSYLMNLQNFLFPSLHPTMHCIHNYSTRLSPVTQSCHSLWPPGLYPPDSSVHGIILARTLKWVNISSSRGSSWPRDQTCYSCISCIAGGFYTPSHWGSQKTVSLLKDFF